MVVGNVMKWERMGMEDGDGGGDSPIWGGGVYVFRVGGESGCLGVGDSTMTVC